MTIYSKLAESLQSMGFDASVWDSGGNVECVQVEHNGFIYLFGTANDTWGAERYTSMAQFEDGEQDGVVSTDCPTSEQDAAVVAKHIAVVLNDEEEATDKCSVCGTEIPAGDGTCEKCSRNR